MLSFVQATDAFGSIFNQFDMPFFAYCFDGFYFDGMSECVHGNAGLDSASGVFVTAFVIFDFRVRFQPGPERKGREPERVFVHIDEYRMGTDITDSIAGGNEGERLDQDLVLLTGINEEKGKMQGILLLQNYLMEMKQLRKWISILLEK